MQGARNGGKKMKSVLLRGLQYNRGNRSVHNQQYYEIRAMIKVSIFIQHAFIKCLPGARRWLDTG